MLMERTVNISCPPKERKFSKVGLGPVDNSYEVLETNSEGTRFRMAAAKISITPKINREVSFTIFHLNKPSRMLFILSATPFCWGVLGTVWCQTIPLFSTYLTYQIDNHVHS